MVLSNTSALNPPNIIVTLPDEISVDAAGALAAGTAVGAGADELPDELPDD